MRFRCLKSLSLALSPRCSGVLYPGTSNMLSVVAGTARTPPAVKICAAHWLYRVVHQALALADFVNESVHEAVEVGDANIHGLLSPLILST